MRVNISSYPLAAIAFLRFFDYTITCASRTVYSVSLSNSGFPIRKTVFLIRVANVFLQSRGSFICTHVWLYTREEKLLVFWDGYLFIRESWYLFIFSCRPTWVIKIDVLDLAMLHQFSLFQFVNEGWWRVRIKRERSA